MNSLRHDSLVEVLHYHHHHLSLSGATHSFEGVGHVAGLDPALELDRESRGGGLSGGGLGGGGLGRGGLGGGSLGRGLGSGGFGRGFVRHGSWLQLTAEA